MNPTICLYQNGDAALDIHFDAIPSAELSQSIIGLQRALQRAMERGLWPELQELIPAYQCLTVCYDPLSLAPATDSGLVPRLQSFVQQTLAAENFPDTFANDQNSRLVEIPVCYGGDFGPDMDAVCRHTGLPRDTVIALHSRPEYLVHMLGFTPGFLYLGGLNEKIHCPRKEKPALRVAAGSVGIGGAQTGIYPQVTPGGWQVIGRTPVSLFDPVRQNPFIAQPLDRIRFVPITAEEFALQEGKH